MRELERITCADCDSAKQRKQELASGGHGTHDFLINTLYFFLV